MEKVDKYCYIGRIGDENGEGYWDNYKFWEFWDNEGYFWEKFGKGEIIDRVLCRVE